MKVLNFSFFWVLSMILFGCSSSSTNNELSFEDWSRSFSAPNVVSDMNPDGNTVIIKEKRVELIDPSVVRVAKTKGDYMTIMARQFRKDLASTSSQVDQKDSVIYMRIPTQAIFGTNQATIKPSFEPILKSMAENLKKHPETMIRIVGHTDNSDTVINSRTLSLRQANAFSNYLRLEGIEADRLLAEGKGSLEPIASNSTSEGRLRNCYIEVTVHNLQ